MAKLWKRDRRQRGTQRRFRRFAPTSPQKSASKPTQIKSQAIRQLWLISPSNIHNAYHLANDALAIHLLQSYLDDYVALECGPSRAEQSKPPGDCCPRSSRDQCQIRIRQVCNSAHLLPFRNDLTILAHAATLHTALPILAHSAARMLAHRTTKTRISVAIATMTQKPTR